MVRSRFNNLKEFLLYVDNPRFHEGFEFDNLEKLRIKQSREEIFG